MVKQRAIQSPDGAWRLVANSGNPDGYKLVKELQDFGANTLPLVVKFSAKKNGSRPCMGTRTIIRRDVLEKDGVKHEKLELGDYVWESYNQVEEKILKVAAGVLGFGLKPRSRIAILAETRADWFIMALGCHRAGITVVTLYTNLNDDAIRHGISETEVDTVVTSFELLPRLSALLPQLSNVGRIIVLEDQLEGIGNIKNFPKNVSYVALSALLLNADLKLLETCTGPKPDDIAIIMYTSGSTGNPKGVLLSHKNIVRSMQSYTCKTETKSTDRYLAFLPLPHVMELSTEIALMAIGACIAYSSPMTLTSNSPKIGPGTVGDARIAQPTYINAVPLILDRVIKGVFTNVEKQGKIKAKIFHEALRCKQIFDTSLVTSIVDLVVFNKVKAELGGKLRLVLTGGAPLSRRTSTLFSTMFGVTLRSGYGLTETTACTSCADIDDQVPSTCGTPNDGVSILLENWEDGGYRITDLPRPRGEVVIGGDIVALGYLNLPEETKNAFFERNGIRYFRSGDIGEFDERGVLHLIDRKKDLVKLQHGEYVALGAVETCLKSHVIVDNICVFGDTNQSYVVAIVVPNSDVLRILASSLDKNESESFENLCRDGDVVKAVLAELTDHARKQKLTKTDIPKKLLLTTELWSPENGLVTSAFKLRRKPLYNKYSTSVAAMYAI